MGHQPTMEPPWSTSPGPCHRDAATVPAPSTPWTTPEGSLWTPPPGRNRVSYAIGARRTQGEQGLMVNDVVNLMGHHGSLDG